MLKEGQKISVHSEGKIVELEIGRCLRAVSRRRAVYAGTCEGRPAVIKLFFSKIQGRRHFKRELNGLKKLVECNVMSPPILAFGHIRDGWLLAAEKVENAKDVSVIFKDAPKSDETRSILKAVFNLLAVMHSAGVLQADLHLGNFLWNGKNVYAMDPAQMRFLASPIDSETCFRQLGNLGTMFEMYSCSEKKELYDTYFQKRGWKFDDSEMKKIHAYAKKASNQGLKRTLKKSLRSCSSFSRVTSGPWCGVFDRQFFGNQNLPAFMSELDKAMETGESLKHGNTCYVCKIQLNGHDVVVKRYNHKGLWHSLRHTIKGSRAKKCWLFGHRLNRLNIPTAIPLAFIEQRVKGILWQSYIINDFINGMTLNHYLKQPDLSEQKKESVLKNIDLLLYRLVESNLTHGDLKLSNILLLNEESVLIDLDSMCYHRSQWLLRIYADKMKKQFMQRLSKL